MKHLVTFIVHIDIYKLFIFSIFRKDILGLLLVQSNPRRFIFIQKIFSTLIEKTTRNY